MKTHCPQSVDLSGEWSLRNAKGTMECPMQLPGDVHSALLAANLIPDPYYGLNEDKVMWVGESDWILTRTVDAPASMLESASVYLNADMLDTFCDIVINGHDAGSAGNAFRRHRFEVKPFLHAGKNEFTLKFRSPVPEMAARAKDQPYPIPCVMGNGRKIPHWNMARKPMCHAGWDWGAALQLTGASGSLGLRATSTARIEHVTTRQDFKEGTCTLHVTAEVHAPKECQIPWSIEIDGRTIRSEARLGKGSNTLQTTVDIPNPRLWWPAGYGKQPLYELRVCVGDETVAKQIGFRSLRVKNEPDTTGRPLTFCVNGVDIFCKGANWIPADALLSPQTPERLRDLIQSARDAHMNMLRVWGGGQFEEDAFYELCDELGIMIWHDFMFACSLYPADRAFLDEVRAETEYQVKRLRDHPSIVLWCGDNENLGMLNWAEESKKNRDRYLLDWDKLNRARQEAAEKADDTHVYWPSSPCAGPGDFSDTFHTDGKGDMHYWAVWHAGKSFDSYYTVRPRFCSEFGYQSFPSMETVESFCPPEDRNITAPVMEFHQRNDAGNRLINEMFSRYFRMPAGFAETLYLSHVQQSVAMKTAVEYWRTLRPECMGTLYWQLNDVWPVASWSSLEYSGKWKQLHYHARRFYAPAIACVVPGKEDAGLWIVNDHTVELNAKVTCELWTFEGELRHSETLEVRVPAGSSKNAKTWPLAGIAPTPAGREQLFLHISLQGKAGSQHVSHENTHWFTEYKRCHPRKADIQCKTDGCELTLTSDFPAFFVQVDLKNVRGEFDDNSLTLLPGRPRKITFKPKEDRPALLPVPSVMHLAKSY